MTQPPLGSYAGLPTGPDPVAKLAILRHLLRLAKEWGYVEKVPRIRLAREPEGRLRFLAEDEIGRLLEACATRAGKSPVLLPAVTLALSSLAASSGSRRPRAVARARSR